MNHPEPIDDLAAIERSLGIPTADAVEVLDRASRDALWPHRAFLGAFETIVRKHWARIQGERAKGGPKP